MSDSRRGPQLHVLCLIAADHALIMVCIDHHTVLTMEAIWEVRIAALRNPTIKAMRHVLLPIVPAIHVKASTRVHSFLVGTDGCPLKQLLLEKRVAVINAT